MAREFFSIAPHACDVVTEHGREWAVCRRCGAQWALHGSDFELVNEGDGSCDWYGGEE